jgi:hypothetical protein
MARRLRLSRVLPHSMAVCAMTLRRAYFIAAVVTFAITICCPTVVAQGPLPSAPAPTPEASGALISTPNIERPPHKFFDKENCALFAGSFALSGADFAVTRSNLQHGGQEFNPLVRLFGRSTAGLAANFAGQGVGTVALSYLFHRTGHHKMERAVSMVNIGGSVGAVGFGLAHR